MDPKEMQALDADGLNTFWKVAKASLQGSKATAGLYGFSVSEEGNLILHWNGEGEPPFEIRGDHLWVNIPPARDLGKVVGPIGPQGPVGPQGPEGNTFEVYSDQEVLIGSWFGESLYRRVINVTSPEKVDILKIVFTPEKNCIIKKLYAFMYPSNTTCVPIPYVTANSQYVYLAKNDSGIGLATNMSILCDKPVTIIMEYTKVE